MSRPLRIQFPGACYLVTNWGNSRQDIFFDDGDRTDFLHLLENSTKIYGALILCYVLMANHFHLILKTRLANLSEFMKHFLLTYTVRFNKRHKRNGHLFQGRYKSIIVDEEAYLLPLSRYIHLNPDRTSEQREKDPEERMKFLMEYPWSSLPTYCSLEKKESWLDCGSLLCNCFGNDDFSVREHYRSYVFSGIDDDIGNPFDDVVHQTILGSESFVQEMKTRIEEGFEREVPSLRGLRRSAKVEDVLEMAANAFGVKTNAIMKKNSKDALGRQMAMELCYRFCHMTQREIGSVFGVDYSTVSQNRKRLMKKMETRKELQEKFDALTERFAGLY